MKKDLILASKSEFRIKQLSQIGIFARAMPSEVDEKIVKAQSLQHDELAKNLAFQKAFAIQQKHPDSIIIGADQVASDTNRVFSKPKSREKAIEQLLSLQGRTHFLHTACSILAPQFQKTWCITSSMAMHSLSLAQIQQYVDFDQAFYCAGSYMIESGGIALFEKIETQDFSSIQGLPLMSLSLELSRLGLNCWNQT
jgi:septum formation protein